MKGKSGSWKAGVYMDRSGNHGGVRHAPSLIVSTVAHLQRGDLSISEVWELLERRVTYRTLQDWKKRGTNWPRYRDSKWWLENHERIDILERRGLTRAEILMKVGTPTGRPVPERKPQPNVTQRNYLYGVWGLIRSMEMAENGRWAA